VLTTNLRSIYNKTDLTNQLLEDTCTSIAFLTETWAHGNNISIINNIISSKYHKISNERTDQPGGGTMILVDRHFSPKIEQLEPTPPLPQPPWTFANKGDYEGQLELTIAKLQPTRLPREFSTLIAVTAYIPEWATNKQTNAIFKLIRALEDPIASNTKNGKPLIYVCGDFNGANTKPLCNAYQLHQINTEPTRNDKVYDIILTNAPACYTTTTMHAIGKSDHKVVVARAPQNKYSLTRPASTKTTVRAGKITDTVSALGTVDWNWTAQATTSRTDQQLAFDKFYDIIRQAEDTCQPPRVIRLKGDKPWMTADIKALIAKRQRLYYRGLFAERATVANEINRLTRIAKRRHFAKFTARNAWKEINQIRSPKDDSAGDPELATIQNNGFYNVWNGLKQPDISSFIPTAPYTNCPKLFDEITILKAIEKQKNGSCGPDTVSTRLIKAARLELASSIASLFNNSLKLSFVPTQWKMANIIAIPKVQHPKTATDYRPIALTSTLCKIFERVIAKHILELTKDKWDSNKQYGFLPGRNTMDAIIQVIEDWSYARDQNLPTQAIFFDFAKAFDLVDHKILLEKLISQLPAWLVSWIAAYLSDRKQRVKAKDIYTDWKPVEAGVIQGSILGPILFLIFIADINHAIPLGIELIKYADDILIYCLSRSWNSTLVQSAADGILNWCNANKMKLNAKKCQEIIMVNGSSTSPQTTALGSDSISRVSSTKYLGTILNDQLDWNQQWEHVQKIVNNAPYLLRQLRHNGFREPVIINVYRCLVLSHFTYNAPVLAQVDKSTMNEMEAFQRRALKSIGITQTSALNDYNIGTIEDHLKKHTSNVLNRILCNPKHAITSKIPRTIARSGRPATFKPNKPRTEKYKNSVLQAHLRTLRDGFSDLYTNTGPHQRNTQIKPQLKTTTQHKTTTVCEVCGKSYINIKTHKTKMGHHNPQTHD
jgi:hypothetical protein